MSVLSCLKACCSCTMLTGPPSSWHIPDISNFITHLAVRSKVGNHAATLTSPASSCWRKHWSACVCTDAGYTCFPRSYFRSIGGGWGIHRSAQCTEANLCHCSGDPSAQRHQGVKFKLLLQPGNSIIWGKDMSLWHILAVFLVQREREGEEEWGRRLAFCGQGSGGIITPLYHSGLAFSF